MHTRPFDAYLLERDAAVADIVRAAAARIPVFHTRLIAAGIDAAAVRGSADLDTLAILTKDQLLEAQRAAALLRDGEAAEAIERYLMSGKASAERRLRAHSIAAGSAFAAGDYRRASDHAAQYLAAATPEPAREVEGMRRLKQIADLLSAEPRQRLGRPP